jgi:PDZ domain-containing protein
VPTGVLVTSVFRDTPAVGKLRPGDVVEYVDGIRVRTPEQLGPRIRGKPIGSTIRLGVRRNSKLETFRLRTVASPNDPKAPIVGIGIEPALRIDLPLDVDIDLGRVGGPSAGLAFALDILEELGRDVDGGRRVAATGEIALDGRVGSVGGVKQKTIGARRSGVDVFLVPAGDNAEEASRHAGDMEVIPVRTFRQALRRLTTLPAPS